MDQRDQETIEQVRAAAKWERQRERAPRLAALIREATPVGPHQHVDGLTCWFCRAKAVLAEIDGPTGSR